MNEFKLENEERKWPPTKEELLDLIRNHSYREIARMYGKSPATICLWCWKLGIPPRSKYKHPRQSFDGDIHEKAYLTGLSEDYNIFRRSSNTIRIQGGSTRPRFIQLTRDIFSKWSHVKEIPCYDEKRDAYYMHIYVDVDNSFDFLLKYKSNRVEFLNEFINNENLYDFVAGLMDSEGSISISIDEENGREWVSLRISNTNAELINWLYERFGGYITVRSDGFNNGYKPVYIWGLNFDAAIKLLQKIELRHPEKTIRRRIILDNLNNLRYARQLLIELDAVFEREKHAFIQKIKQMIAEKKCGQP